MSDGLYTLGFANISAGDHARVGGKCASLGVMTQAGVTVPPGFAVTTDAYAAMLAHHSLPGLISDELAKADPDDVDAVEAASQRIRAHISRFALPEPVESAIRSAYAGLCAASSGNSSMPVAVRSSATAEDMPDASFAGQQDTYLWITGADAVLEKVRDCWASLYTARAIAYRNKNSIVHQDVLMSVAVQKMVNARAAGVAMTLDPLNGDRTRIIIDASWGLGETVVSGTVTPDNFTVEKIMEQIVARRIADKHIELVGDAAAGRAVERHVDEARRTVQCVSDAEVLAVARLAKRLEKQNKCPQDVEWAIDADLPEGDNVVALQSRPETVWSQKKPTGEAKTYATGMMSIVGTLNNPLAARKPGT